MNEKKAGQEKRNEKKIQKRKKKKKKKKKTAQRVRNYLNLKRNEIILVTLVVCTVLPT